MRDVNTDSRRRWLRDMQRQRSPFADMAAAALVGLVAAATLVSIVW